MTRLITKLIARRTLPGRTFSWIAAMIVWALISALAVFITLGLRDRARLIRDNDNERLLSMIFSGFWEQSDGASVIEANPLLKERLAGFAIYGNDMRPVDSWGDAPAVFDKRRLNEADADKQNRWANKRWTLPGKRGRITFVMRTGRIVMIRAGSGGRQLPAPLAPPEEPFAAAEEPFAPPSALSQEAQIRASRRPGVRPFLGSQSLMRDGYLYLDIYHAAYWRALYGTAIGFALVELGLFVLVFYTRALYARNAEYRARIEAQKNLVALGSAASTLAHEIKNPLLSIRLQTGILEKSLGGKGAEELILINEEIDRLSTLVYRVNDYLRDPLGVPALLDARALVQGISRRLRGKEMAVVSDGEDTEIYMDSGRAASVFENVIRNAVESGSEAEQIRALIRREGAERIVITIMDRGKGVAPEHIARVFEPFFTSKSAGMGIGLAVSRRFVEAAGGTITLKNRSHGGVKVEISLPYPSARSL